MATAVPATEKRCLGPCGRMLPLRRFRAERKNPDGRAARCRECRHVPESKAEGVALARRHEHARLEYFAKRIGDPELERSRRELAAWVRRNGAVKVGRVEYGWRYLEKELVRSIAGR